jgi:hypothetical protein
MDRWLGRLSAVLVVCCLGGCEIEATTSPQLLATAGAGAIADGSGAADVRSEDVRSTEAVISTEGVGETEDTQEPSRPVWGSSKGGTGQLNGFSYPEVTMEVGGCEEVPLPWVAEACQLFCAKLTEHGLEELFPPAVDCPGNCVEVLAEEPEFLANFICVSHMQKHYFFSDCWWPKPLPALPGCSDFCTNLSLCGLQQSMGMPEDQCLCEAACSGFFAMQGSAASQRLECATESLANVCDLEEMFQCSEILDDCPDRCAELAQICGGEEGLGPLFTTSDSCVVQCQAYSAEQFFALEQCVSATSCTHPEYCSTIPEEPSIACEESCGTFFDICPGLPVEPDECVWACSGISNALPDGLVDLVPPCLSELDVCPDDPLDKLVACFADPCKDACPAPDSCPVGSDYQELFSSSADCQVTCQSLSSAQAATFSTCLAWAGCHGASQCLPVASESLPGCKDYCAAAFSLCNDKVPFQKSLCPAACAGITQAVAVADPVAGLGCLLSHFECPSVPEAAVYGCLVPTDDLCNFRCLKESACGLSQEWSCNFSCVLEKEASPALFQNRTECVAGAITCLDIADCLADGP